MSIPRTMCVALACLLVHLAQAQPYPTRPVRLIVPLAAGGAMDTIARGVGAKLTDSLGQTVVVDNRGGGGGTLGAELVAAAAPDGYTLIMMSATSVIRPLLYSARYEMVRDFAPISQVSAQPYLLVAHPSIPAKTVQELVAYAKANPGKLNYASAGPGQHHPSGDGTAARADRNADDPRALQRHGRSLPGPHRGQHPDRVGQHRIGPAARARGPAARHRRHRPEAVEVLARDPDDCGIGREGIRGHQLVRRARAGENRRARSSNGCTRRSSGFSSSRT